jgi:beta-phosphoglucomutase
VSATAIRAVVFDFDGILADSEPLHLRAYQDVLRAAGIRLTRERYYVEYLGYDDREMLRRVADDFGLMLADEELELLLVEKTRRFEALVARGSVLYPSAPPCVQRLRKTYPLGIASGALRRDIDFILDGSSIADAFAFIVAAEDTDRAKPAPDPYLLAAARHGQAPAACVAIEDSSRGLESARGAGLRTIAVTTNYSDDVLAPHADIVVSTLDAVTPALIESLERYREGCDGRTR